MQALANLVAAQLLRGWHNWAAAAAVRGQALTALRLSIRFLRVAQHRQLVEEACDTTVPPP